MAAPALLMVLALVGIGSLSVAGGRLIPDLPSFVPGWPIGLPEEDRYREVRDQLLVFHDLHARYTEERKSAPTSLSQLRRLRLPIPQADPWGEEFVLRGARYFTKGADATLDTNDDLYVVGDNGMIGLGLEGNYTFDMLQLLRRTGGFPAQVRELLVSSGVPEAVLDVQESEAQAWGAEE